MIRPRLTLPVLLAASLTANCGGEAPSDQEPAQSAGEEPAAAEAPPAAPMTVEIVSPTDGATVEGPDVLVTLDVSGLEIVPAGEDRPRSGHHHLLVNIDLPALDQPIPNVAGESIHMGAAQTEYELTDLSPGEYRVIALVGDFAHVPLSPLVVDTVRFTVR